MIPKFRAWSKDEKEMIEVLEIDFRFKTIEFVKLYDQIPYAFSKYFSEIELMQSTGLKDKNGTEIYEGYIVEFKYPYDKRIKTKGVIVRNDNKACFGISMKETTEQYELYRITAENYLTVIGNKFQNPELLEDK